MSRSVAYSVLIRDGQKKYYADVWGTLYRDLIWGPEAYEEWLKQGQEMEDEPEEISGSVIVDFDRRELRWGECEALDLPRSQELHHRLMQASWPGYSITLLPHAEIESEVRGHEDSNADDPDEEGASEGTSIPGRASTVSEVSDSTDDAAGDSEDDESDEEEDDPSPPTKAWLTIIDQNGKIRQRTLEQISADLVTGVKAAVQELARLKSAEVPPEKSVKEGMWINLRDKEIGFWGCVDARRDFEKLKQGWSKWNVRWADEGYVEQCRIGGVSGVPMTNAEALARFVPTLLSTKKIDPLGIFQSMGGAFRKTAMKATGCLIVMLAIPILIIGYFMGKMAEAGYTIGGLVVLSAMAFKLIEFRIRKKFRDSALSARFGGDEERPPVSGPMDEAVRRRRLDSLLASCKFPLIKELEPHFAKAPSIEDLMS